MKCEISNNNLSTLQQKSINFSDLQHKTKKNNNKSALFLLKASEHQQVKKQGRREQIETRLQNKNNDKHILHRTHSRNKQ